MKLTEVPFTTTSALLEGCSGVLLDASGVLIHHGGAFDGAAAFIDLLNRRQIPYVVLSNDASRTPETLAARLGAAGVAVPPNRVLTTGTLLGAWFAENDLAGGRAVVLGPEDAFAMVQAGGGVATSPDPDSPLDVLVVADEAGYPFVPWVDAALTQVYRTVRAGGAVRVVVPNPDLVYVRGPEAVGVTAGAIAALLRAAFKRLLGAAAPQLEFLGKPHAPLFEAGLAHLSTRDAVMIGDQLATDIAGARALGLPAILVGTGLTDIHAPLELSPEQAPTWRLPSLSVPPDRDGARRGSADA